MQPRELCVLDQTRRMLAEAQSLDEIKLIRDKAEAVRQYAKSAAAGLELQNRAAEVKLLAERRAGELLTGLGLRGGDRTSATNQKVRLRDLGVSFKQSQRWQLEASVPQDMFQQYLGNANQQGQELTSAGLLRLARSCPKAAEPQPDRARAFQEVADSLRRMADQGRSFACIYADPPWARDRTRRKQPGIVPAEMLQGLSSLPVMEVSRRNAHLHLWTIPESLAAALCVLKAWGFRYQTHLVWTKAPMDYGPYWRPAHELLLLGVRGSLSFRDSGLSSWLDGQFFSPADKPPSMRKLVERASLGPYLDVFGWGTAPGWTFAACKSDSAGPSRASTKQ